MVARVVAALIAASILAGAAPARADDCLPSLAPEREAPRWNVCRTVTLAPGTPEARRIVVWPGDVEDSFQGSLLDSAKENDGKVRRRANLKTFLVLIGIPVAAGGTALLALTVSDAQRDPFSGLADALYGVLGGLWAVGGTTMIIVGLALPADPLRRPGRPSVAIGPGSARLSFAF